MASGRLLTQFPNHILKSGFAALAASFICECAWRMLRKLHTALQTTALITAKGMPFRAVNLNEGGAALNFAASDLPNFPIGNMITRRTPTITDSITPSIYITGAGGIFSRACLSALCLAKNVKRHEYGYEFFFIFHMIVPRNYKSTYTYVIVLIF